MLSRIPGMRRIVNRRPKVHEVENLPEIRLKNATRYSIPEIKKNNCKDFTRKTTIKIIKKQTR